MAKFRLLPGGPAKIDGRVLRPGDTVNHASDLSKMFKNRFELVSGTPQRLAEDGGDEDPVPVVSGLTPHDVSTTRRSAPGATFAAKEPPEPGPEDNAPVTRPANAPRGGTSDEGGGEIAEEEVNDETDDAEGEEPAPAPTRRSASKAATRKTTTTRKGR